MFCARCWAPVEPFDRSCSLCGADLTLPGSVRLTDPRRVLGDDPPVRSAAAARQPPASVDASALVSQTGPGWWQAVKLELLAIDEQAAAAQQAISQPAVAAPKKVVHGATQTPRPGKPVAAPDGPKNPPAGTQLQPQSDLPTPGQPVQVLTLAGQPDLAPSVQPTPDQHPVRQRRVRSKPGELSLWDDYGMAEAPSWPALDSSAPRARQAVQLLGATAVPTAKTVTFLAILAGTILLLVSLLGWLINMDTLIVVPGPGGSPTPLVPTSEATQQPGPATSAPVAPLPPPRLMQTPSIAPGAKECQPGLWAGQQTSCVLASAVAQQVRLDMAGSLIVEAYSSASDRTYRLECIADRGITCTGLDGVEGVHVWFATP